jgi:ABC-type uncharacterized transport system substrate-binding protein
MTRNKKLLGSISIGVLLLAVAAIIVATKSRLPFSHETVKGKHFKIFHIMSYHSPWQWTDDQVKGFKAGIAGIDIDFREFQLDAKNNSAVEAIEKRSKEACEIIDTWHPDLVFTSDDAVQEYVVKKYINSNIPFVFSGVNADPKKYGFDKSRNITGVLEEEHFVQSAKLLLDIKPSVKRIAIVLDDDPMWEPVVKRSRKKAAEQIPDIDFVYWDVIKTFDEYKRKIKEYESTVDAVCIIGWFTFKDNKGNNVSEMDVGRWTAENSRLPDYSFWKDRVSKGTLCSVYVSAYEQGLKAGKDAYMILAQGVSPSDIKMEPSVKGRPAISLYRAKKLGIKLNSTVLLSSDVIEKTLWQK